MDKLLGIETLDAYLKTLKGYLTPEILTYAGAGLAVLLLIILLVKLIRKRKISPHFQVALCRNCGWEGEVSRWAGVCPQCNNPLGDRKLKKQP
ncbi:MAG TPA: hypothetical protein VIU33_03170 [Nitrospiria bacterium]